MAANPLLWPGATAPQPLNGLLRAPQPFAQPSRLRHLEDAHQALGLTPQEVALYQRHLSNLYGPGGVDNPDGSRSTLYQATMTGPDGRAYAIPTVWNGAIVRDRNRLLGNIDAAGGLAAFPSYGSVEEAEARYQQMHNFIDRDTADYFGDRAKGWRE